MTTGKRVDLNHASIRQAVQQIGATWLDLTQARFSPLHCDALVLFRGRVMLAEVKQPGKADDLTEDEQKFHRDCEAVGVKVWILEDVDDAIGMLAE